MANDEAIQDSTLIVTLTVGQLKTLVQAAVRVAMVQEGYGPDRLLTVGEAARKLQVSKDWIYRNHKRLQFATKLGPKNVRCSERGIEKWITARRD